MEFPSRINALDWLITILIDDYESINLEGASASDQEKELLKDEVIALQREQLNMLKQAIKEKAPELAEYLRLKEL